MFQRLNIQRSIGSISPVQYKEQLLHFHCSHSPVMTGETLMSYTMENENYYGPAYIVHPKASHVLSADLECAKNRYLVSGRLDGNIAIHDLHSTTFQTIGPVTRKVFPSVLNIKAPDSGVLTYPVNKVEWYPGDYGHFSSLSTHEKALKIWDPNKGRTTESVKFPEDSPQDHSSSAHQPIIAVALKKEIRLIDLRTGHTGQKLQRPKSSLDRFRRCCHRAGQPSLAFSSVDAACSTERSHARSLEHKNKKCHKSSPQKSPSKHLSSLSLSSRTPSSKSPASQASPRNSSRSDLNNQSRGNPSLLERSTQARSNDINSRALAIQRRQAYRGSGSANICGRDYIDDVSCVSFHPTMPSALTAGYLDGSVVMWDVRSSRSYLFDLMDHYSDDGIWLKGAKIKGLRYSSDGRYLASFTRDAVLLWDGYTGERMGDSLPFIGNLNNKLYHRFNDVKISAAAKCIFVCMSSRIHSFNLPSGTEIAQFNGHMQDIEGLVIDHSQHRLFTYGQDAQFITWSFHGKEPYVNVRKCCFSEPRTAGSTRPEQGNDDWSTDEDSD